jgi:acetyl-CoA synthetase
MLGTEPVWRPTPQRIAASALTRLANRAGVVGYDGLRNLALSDLDAYWRFVIADLGIQFSHDFDRVVDVSAGPEWPRWFSGGRMNFTDTVLHGGSTPAGDDEIALICTSETAPRVDFSRAALRREVAGAMSRLSALGVGRGDRVALLLPNIAEAVFVILAAARLGGIVVPLYSGFGPDPIATRISLCGAKVVVACDGFIRGGKRVAVKAVLDTAIAASATVQKVALIRRLPQQPASMMPGRDVWWDELPSNAAPEAAVLDPNDPWMIIFTSGTSGLPKGTVHIHGGFPLRVAHDVAYMFDFHARDRFFWFSDMGWMIGPMAACAPLSLGGSLVLYEGGPITPDAAHLLRIAADTSVTHYGSSPTMLRTTAAAFPSLPTGVRRQFKTLMSSGEAIDDETFRWFHDEVGGGGTPIINYTGGTEVSGGILSNIVVRPIIPSTFNAAVTDVDADVLGDDGNSLVDAIGELVLRRPSVGMTQGFWGEPGRYIDSYWSKRPGVWAHGDLARRAAGLWEICGRADDVLKISGRRVGPSEIERAALDDGDLIAAAAIGVADPKSGQAILLFAVPADPGQVNEPGFALSIRERVSTKLGPGLRPREVVLVTDLPRTRNGKIMRRVVRNLLVGEPVGDLSSLDNPESLDAVARYAAKEPI